MKKFNDKFGLIGWLLLISIAALGASVDDNTFRIGDKTGSDVEIQMGDGRLKWDNTSSKLQFSNDLGASLKEIGSGGGAASGINILENADFETGTPPSNWTASGGSFTAVNDGFDTQAGQFDASAGSQNLDSDFQSVPLGLENRHCNATIQYKYASGSSGDYKLQVVANTAGLLAEKDIDVSSDWNIDGLQFTCPSSDSIKIRITSTVDAGAIQIDNATLGRTNFFSISQTTIYGQASNDTDVSCAWTTTSATFADFGADADCTWTSNGGVVGTAQLPQITLTDAPPGKYEVIADFNYSVTGDTTDTTCRARIFDGTSVGDLALNEAVVKDASISNNGGDDENNIRAVYTKTTNGTHTFKLQGLRVTGDGSCQISNEMTWIVKRYPISAAEAITLETVGQHWDVNIGGANIDLGTSNQTSYVEITNSGLDMVLNTGSDTAKIPCSATNTSSGTTCSVGDEGAGIVIDVKTAGRYKACADFSHQLVVEGGDEVLSTFQWVETADGSQTILQEGKSRVNSRNGENASDTDQQATYPHRLCGTFVFASPGEKVLRLMYEQFIAGTPSLNIIDADRASSFGQRDIHITVDKMDQQFPTPVFTDLQNSLDNKVSSTEDNLQQIGAQFTCSGSSSIADQTSGSFASVGNISSGNCTLSLDAALSGTQFISCNVSLVSTGPFAIVGIGAVTDGTSIGVSCHEDDGVTDCTSFGAMINCVLR